MNTLIIIFIFLSILFGGTVYIVTLNIYLSIAILVISLLYFFFIALNKIKKSNIKTNRFHECYNFINTFIISLSIKKSIKNAFDDTAETMSDSFKEIANDLIDLNINEKLNYITTIYPFHIFSLFLNVINLWIEEGGDILAMSTHLINECKNVEEYLLACQRMSRKKYVEFSILWLITIAILVFIKFALKDFYVQLSNQLVFPIAVSLFFVFVLISIHVLINRTTSIELRGWSDEKKF